MMQAKTLVLILGAVVFSAAGQLFLKSGAQHLAGLGRLDFLLAASRDVHVLSGLAAWAASTLCWLYVLRVAPLSRAYGLTSLTYVLILAGERLPLRRTGAPPARRGHGADRHRHRLPALRGLSAVREMAERAYFQRVPDAGTAAAGGTLRQVRDRPITMASCGCESAAASTRRSWSGWAVRW